jgi:hypothetical protein
MLGLPSSAAAEEEPAPAVTPELAGETLDRVDRLRSEGSPGEELLLGDAQLSSVIRHALPGILPEGVDTPEVEVRDGRLRLSAVVATGAFPELPRLEEMVGFLPDTVPIRMTGTITSTDGSTAVLLVEGIQAARIPLPARFTPEILGALGREDREGLPPNALLLPLPSGLRSVYVRQDSLVLVADD